MFVKHLMLCAAAGLSLAACSTPEYQRAAAECRQQALQSWPVVMEQRLIRRSRTVMVPDGSTTCQSTQTQSSGRQGDTTQAMSTCRQGMRRAIEYFDEPGTVDVNAGSRERYVDDCATSLCVQRFGNGRCDK